MSQLLKRLGRRVLGVQDSRHVQELQRSLAARTREIEELRQAKNQELRAVWDHAHDLDRALQRLDAFVRSGASVAPADEDPGRIAAALAHFPGPKPPDVASVIVPDIAPTEEDVRI